MPPERDQLFKSGQIAARLIGRPLLIHPAKLAVLYQAVRLREGLPPLQVELDVPDGSPTLEHFDIDEQGRTVWDLRVQDGIAIIDVGGTLVPRAHGLNAASGLSSYERIAGELEAAIEDPQVKAVLLHCDSPGGDASGSMECADRIYELARGPKPVVALAQDDMMSGCYLIASQCQEVYATQTGLVGSIGVASAHVDLTGAHAQAGVLITEIYAGARKVDGSPNHVLGDEERTELQALADAIWTMFSDKVARGRNLSTESVKATQARIFLAGAGDAERLGLIDGIRSPRDLLEDLRGRVGLTGARGGRATASLSAVDGGAAMARETRVAARIEDQQSPEDAPAPPSERPCPKCGTPGSGKFCTACGSPMDASPEAASEAPAADVLAAADGNPAQLAAVLAKTAPGTMALLQRREAERVAAIRKAALPGQEKLAEQLSSDPSMTLERAQAVYLENARAKRASVVAGREAEEQAMRDHGVSSSALPTAALTGSATSSVAPKGVEKASGAARMNIDGSPLDLRCRKVWAQHADLASEFPSYESFRAFCRIREAELEKLERKR